MPVYDKTYIEANVREFDGKIKRNFLDDRVLKENIHYACIAGITIDCVMRMDIKSYLQVDLEERKYKVKKIDVQIHKR